MLSLKTTGLIISSLLLFFSLLLLTGLLLLTKYDATYKHSVNNTPKIEPHRVELPALPLIQQAVAGLVPAVDGPHKELIMSQVCALARGERSQEQVAQTLVKFGIDISNIPQQGHPLSLLVETDKSSRIIGCAAYVANSVMVVPKPTEFMTSTDKPSGVSSGKKNEVGTKEKTLSIDAKKLAQYLRVQLSVARADADIFVIIAVELQKKSGLTADQYTVQAKKIFSEYALAYLQRVKALHAESGGTHYKLIIYSDEYFKFISSDGYLFEYGYDGLSLYFNKIPWYEGGKLLGKDYFLSTSYSESVLAKRIQGEALSHK
ncbi:Uncharacterised protein [Yersinia pseudotuberculosis]|uniref:Uncharacterized protein n=28 Tax=Yersinia TaxID=629 RepID=A0A0H3B357_YERPY|nr:hypothetical protein [Yersinia pseudotuberculosis]AIN16041.1 hypothetical protein DJ40_4174 [Yersinia pseudotuberculosis]AJJ08540.1 hypothetical protein BZ20_3809 [Yersinia pseudotuberculosis]AJJ58813.1 hypothetical protein BZ22_2322 [Yersinia pseudotuberculosis YPIII]AYW87749.1 hypothetical protein EGX87_11505 [Yersinia pseudotuberculosis]AYW98499.1 hypothetical protein EGX53_00670 [Yersinia pseudotuberculosis]